MSVASNIRDNFVFLLWPVVLTGGIVAFALSATSAIHLLDSNAHKFIKPIGVSRDFNMPPVQQLAELTPLATYTPPVRSAAAVSETGSFVELAAAPAETQSIVSAPPVTEPVAAVAATMSELPPGRVGRQAVNIRSGPNKNAAKRGVLQAGAEIRLGENRGGWVHVYHDGGDGWIYQDFIAPRTEITVFGGSSG